MPGPTQERIELPAATVAALPRELPRRELALSKNRRLIVKREGGYWHVGVGEPERAGTCKLIWHEGRSETLSRALDLAAADLRLDFDVREVDLYLIDVVYAL